MADLEREQERARRTAWVHIRLSPAERDAWQRLAADGGGTLADLIRQRMGEAAAVGRSGKRRAARRADPALLAALARIGANVNQIAKWVNTHKSAADASQVLAALIALDRDLLSYRPNAGDAEAD